MSGSVFICRYPSIWLYLDVILPCSGLFFASYDSNSGQMKLKFWWTQCCKLFSYSDWKFLHRKLNYSYSAFLSSVRDGFNHFNQPMFRNSRSLRKMLILIINKTHNHICCQLKFIVILWSSDMREADLPTDMFRLCFHASALRTLQPGSYRPASVQR